MDYASHWHYVEECGISGCGANDLHEGLRAGHNAHSMMQQIDILLRFGNELFTQF